MSLVRNIRRRGVGEYPGYYCFDANRPSWVPYWFDTPTESACKWNPGTIIGNIAACSTGASSCSPPTAAQQNPALSGPGIVGSSAGPGVSNNPSCPAFQSYDFTSAQCVFDPTSGSFMVAVAGGLGLLVIALLMSGGRR